MIKSYFVDGDKGGVGKSFLSRCLADSFINHEVSGMPKIDKLIVIDADPMNPDVVCEHGYKNEVVNDIQIIGMQRPIKSEDDWLNLINELAETQINETDEIRLVFSLPSAAGLYITESVLSLMALMNPTPIWVMGIDASSTNQLEVRVGKSPMFYQQGVVLVNMKHGAGKSFEYWDKSKIRKTLLSGEDYSWTELELPAMMPRAAELIGSMPLHTVIDKGNLPGSGVAIGTRTVAQTYRGIAGRKLATLESSK
jgi:hypothetical protein